MNRPSEDNNKWKNFQLLTPDIVNLYLQSKAMQQKNEKYTNFLSTWEKIIENGCTAKEICDAINAARKKRIEYKEKGEKDDFRLAVNEVFQELKNKINIYNIEIQQLIGSLFNVFRNETIIGELYQELIRNDELWEDFLSIYNNIKDQYCSELGIGSSLSEDEKNIIFEDAWNIFIKKNKEQLYKKNKPESSGYKKNQSKQYIKEDEIIQLYYYFKKEINKYINNKKTKSQLI